MTPIGIQQRLDAAGDVTLPAGDWLPAVPLFLDGAARVRGFDASSRLNAYYSGSAFMVGVPRGLVGDDHYQPDGFRTRGDSLLWANGDHWSLGPPAGWPSVGVLTIRARITSHGGAWNGLGICGVQANTGQSDPEPWQIYTETGWLTLAVRTGDRTVREFRVAITDAATTLDFVWVVDLAAGAVSCTLGGVSQTVSGTLPAGSTLAPNSVFGFAAGQLTPFPAAEGYFGGTWADLTIHDLEVTCDGNQLGRVYATQPRPQTYAGGPSLPLVVAGGSHGGRWLVAVKRGQHSLGIASGVRIEDVRILGADSCPAIQHGGVQGGLSLDRVTVVGGARALSSIMSAVAYPVHVSGCHFQGQTDCGWFAYRAGYSTIERTGIAYAKRAALHFVGSDVAASDVMESPGGEAGEATVIQSGGRCRYSRVSSDYEYDPGEGYKMFRIEPTSWDFNWFPTLAEIDRCFCRATATLVDPAGIADVGERPALYAGESRVVVDGEVVHAVPAEE